MRSSFSKTSIFQTMFRNRTTQRIARNFSRLLLLKSPFEKKALLLTETTHHTRSTVQYLANIISFIIEGDWRNVRSTGQHYDTTCLWCKLSQIAVAFVDPRAE